MRAYKFASIAFLLIGVSACVAGTDPSHQAAQGGIASEVLLGFWHGFIAPFTLIGEIINELVPGFLPWTFQMYEKQNTGVVYDVGFLVGLFAAPSFATAGGMRRRRLSR